MQGREDTEDRAQRRVLIAAFCVVPSATLDGMSVLATIRALHRHYAIDVVSVRTETQPHVERMLRARILRVPLAGATEAERMDSFRRAVRRQLEGEQYDVVHVRGPLEGLPVCELRDGRAFKIVYEFATFPATEGGAAEAARRDEMVCLSSADLVIAGSEAARAHLYQRGVGERVAVIPRGIDVDLFDWDFTRPSPVPVLAALGPFPKSRDVGTLLQAIAIVLREHPVRVRLLGESDPARADALGEKIQTLELGAAVEITGSVDLDEVPAAIASADIGIACAAPVERYLRAGDWVPGVLEFMACRRPVVAARVPAIRDVFTDRRELLLYEPGDPESLAEAILTLLRSSTRRDALAQAGYRRVREDFPASATRRRLLGVYKTLADPMAERPSAAPSTSRTPTPISMATHDTVIVSTGSDSEEYGSGGTRDTSPGVSLADVGEARHLDTDPEIRLKREAGVEPAVVVDPSILGADTELPDALRRFTPPEPPAAEPGTGETDVPELPREQTRSMATSSVGARKSRPMAAVPESAEVDLAEEPTRAVALPTRGADTLDGTLEVSLPASPEVTAEHPAPLLDPTPTPPAAPPLPEAPVAPGGEARAADAIPAAAETPIGTTAPAEAGEPPRPAPASDTPPEGAGPSPRPATTPDAGEIPPRFATMFSTITPRASLPAPSGPPPAPPTSSPGAPARATAAAPPARAASPSAPSLPAPDGPVPPPAPAATPAAPTRPAPAPAPGLVAPPRPTTASRGAVRAPLPPPPPAPPPRRPVVPPPGAAAKSPTPRPEVPAASSSSAPPPPVRPSAPVPPPPTRPRPASSPHLDVPTSLFSAEVTTKATAEGGREVRPPAPSRTPPPLPAPAFEPDVPAVVRTDPSLTGPDTPSGDAVPTLVPVSAAPAAPTAGAGHDDEDDEPSAQRLVIVEAAELVEEVRPARVSSRPPPPPPPAPPAPPARVATSDPPSRPRAVTPAPPLRLPADAATGPAKREGSVPPPAPERTPPPREPSKG